MFYIEFRFFILVFLIIYSSNYIVEIVLIINFFFLIKVINLLYILLCLSRQPLNLGMSLFIFIVSRTVSEQILFRLKLINNLRLVVFTFIDILAICVIICLYIHCFIFIYFFYLFSYDWRLAHFFWTAYFIFIQNIFPFWLILIFVFVFLLFFCIFNFKFFLNVLCFV